MTRRTGTRRPAAARTAAELAALVPWLTPRQLEYWIEQGWIIATPAAGPPAQGRPREFSAAEYRVLRTMARLVRAGFPARVAAQVARRAVTLVFDSDGMQDGDEAQIALAGGDLLLVIRDI